MPRDVVKDFKNAAHKLDVLTGKEPDYKFYDAKTKTLYEVDRKGEKLDVKKIQNPTAEQREFSEDLGHAHTRLYNQMSAAFRTYNESVTSVSGFQSVGYSQYNTNNLSQMYNQLESSYYKGKGTDAGNITDKLADEFGGSDSLTERTAVAEKSLVDIKSQVEAVATVDRAISASAPRPAAHPAPTSP